MFLRVEYMINYFLHVFRVGCTLREAFVFIIVNVTTFQFALESSLIVEVLIYFAVKGQVLLKHTLVGHEWLLVKICEH